MIKLWRVEFCHSTIGVYDYQWFSTKPEAKKYIKSLIDEGYDPVTESTGEDDTVLTTPHDVDIELTLEGVLHFANCYAVDTGSC